jgi:hypothetical protein
MGFLPVFYASAWFLLAAGGYVTCACFETKLTPFARTVFVAILAFGAFSYAGFIVVILAINFFSSLTLLTDHFQAITFAVAYIVPGILGSWLSLKVLRSVLPTSKAE